jgi:hypothetical protein
MTLGRCTELFSDRKYTNSFSGATYCINDRFIDLEYLSYYCFLMEAIICSSFIAFGSGVQLLDEHYELYMIEQSNLKFVIIEVKPMLTYYGLNLLK